MSTLYLDRKGTALSASRSSLQVSEGGESRLRTLPMSLLERIVVQHNCQIDSNTLLALSRNGISLIVLGKRGDVAHLLGTPHKNAEPRVLQYRLFQHSSICEQLAVETVHARIAAQERLLQQLCDRRADLNYPLSRAIRSLRQQLLQLDPGTGIPRLRGIEGGAAASYFRGFSTLFPPSLQFRGRKRRPPPDPVNALLSLGYTLLHSDAVKAAWCSGLDPWVSYYHDLSYGRESLASDLIESHRHHVERMVWELFSSRTIGTDHFSQVNNSVLLNKAGRKIFYQHWEGQAPALRRVMRMQGYRLVRWLQEQNQ